MRLRDTTVIVTGGTRSLGRHISEAMLLEGANVVCAAREIADMARITEIGGRHAVYHRVDVRDAASVTELMKFAADHFGRIDVLVNNAAASIDAPMAAIGATDWETVIDTNLTGALRCVQAALPFFPDSGGGRIINVSSALSSRPASGAGAYCCSKAALDMLTKVCAAEFAGLGITVNALAPGFTDEGMGRRVSENELAWAAYRPRLLAGRLGSGVEIAAAAVFLASRDASYLNGHVLEVNGGLGWC